MEKGFLSGYKTYVVAALTVLYAVAMYAVGEMTLMEAVNYVIAGGGLAALRAAISKAE